MATTQSRLYAMNFKPKKIIKLILIKNERIIFQTSYSMNNFYNFIFTNVEHQILHGFASMNCSNFLY